MGDAPQPDRKRRHRRAAGFGLVGAVLLLGALYWPALCGGFLYDEGRLVLDTPEVQQGAPWAAFCAHPTRGVAMASYALTHRWAGGTVWIWRLTEWGLHLVASLLISLLCASLLGKTPHRPLLTVGGGLLFAFHPLAVEPATYVWARPAVLYVLLTLATVLLLHRLARRGTGMGWLGLVCVLALLLSLLCKEVAPLILLPSGWLVMGLHRPRFLTGGVAALGAGLAVVLVAWCSGLVDGALLGRLSAGRLDPPANLWRQLWSQCQGVAVYARLLVPLRGQYTLVHPVDPGGSVGQAVLGGGIFLAAAVGAVWCAYRRQPLAALGLALGVSALLPYMVLPSRPVVEYKAYLGLAGAVLLGVDLLGRLFTESSDRRILTGLFLVLFVWSGYVTHGHAAGRSSPERIWHHAIQLYPGNPEPKTALAELYLAQGRDREARKLLESAVGDVTHALEAERLPLVHNWHWPFHALAAYCRRHRQPERAEVLWRNALELFPSYVDAHCGLAELYLERGDREAARRSFDQARRYRRDNYDEALIQRLAPRFGEEGL